MDHTHSFGYWLRRRRKALDLTQAELAQRASCSLELIRKIEADARRPSRQLAEKLADSLGIDPAERVTFVQAARAERSADRLALPSQPVEQPAAALPQGTITFLFTDIEGSTRLWEHHPRSMSVVLARHDALLNEIIAAYGGVVFKTVGDSALAAFSQAPDALAAALAAQRAVRAEPWALPEPLRVRMALHTGHAEVRAGDYFGAALNRAARLLDAGHGEQVLLSLATEQLVREELPSDAGLRDLGVHRLKDLSLPEQIFQVVTSDLPATFPPLNTLNTRHTNLPIQPTALLGREQEVAAVATLLRRSDMRLVTLTGPGGIGKTRLSQQVAAELLDDFPNGVYFVDLAPSREPSSVINTIAVTLGVRERGGQPLLETLKGYFRDKQMLLLLDNFEQVLDAGPMIAQLLTTARALKVLVTSREVLHLRGEREVPVAPLALPDPAHLPSLEQLSQYAAVALFIERALDARPDFMVTNANAPAVAEICARLDGLPLAIELAAARLKLFPPEALLARLSSRMALLTSGPRDLPARQQTIRNTIAWSYDLLSEAEQTLFRRLGVFVGGCTLEAAEVVCGDQELKLENRGWKMQERLSILDLRSSILNGLTALVDKSLLQQREDSAGAARFAMLETIREYVLERLQASGEAQQLHRQHAAYFLAFSFEQPAEDEDTWRRRVGRDHDNIQSALEWSQTTAAGDSEAALYLARTLGRLWFNRGIHQKAITMLQRTLDHPLGVGRTGLQAWVREMLASFLGITGNYRAAQAEYEQALELARELSESWLHPWILCRLGWLAREQGDSATAWARLTESVALFRELGDDGNIAEALNTLAEVAILDEDPARAEALLAESHTIEQREHADPDTIGWALNHLGHAAQLRGNYQRAAELHQESLAIFRTMGERNYGLLWAYHGLGETALGLGRFDEAARWLAQGLALSQSLGDQASIAWYLAGLGTAAALDEQPGRAARLWGAAERLRQEIGCRPAPAARAIYERAIAIACGQLGEEAFAAAWAEGRTLTLEQAIAEAMDDAAAPST